MLLLGERASPNQILLDLPSQPLGSSDASSSSCLRTSSAAPAANREEATTEPQADPQQVTRAKRTQLLAAFKAQAAERRRGPRINPRIPKLSGARNEACREAGRNGGWKEGREGGAKRGKEDGS